MNSTVKHLQRTHEALCKSINEKHGRIVQMEESLTIEKERLSSLIEEANAIFKAIGVLSDEEQLPTRLEGSD